MHINESWIHNELLLVSSQDIELICLTRGPPPYADEFAAEFITVFNLITKDNGSHMDRGHLIS